MFASIRLGGSIARKTSNLVVNSHILHDYPQSYLDVISLTIVHSSCFPSITVTSLQSYTNLLGWLSDNECITTPIGPISLHYHIAERPLVEIQVFVLPASMIMLQVMTITLETTTFSAALYQSWHLSMITFDHPYPAIISLHLVVNIIHLQLLLLLNIVRVPRIHWATPHQLY